MTSALCRGRVSHRRLRPRPHALRYRIVSLLLDIDELDRLGLRLLKIDRRGLFAFRRRDVGDGSGSLRGFAERLAGIEGGRIRLLTMPRVLGMAFNPLTVWLVEDRAGALRTVIYEVNNTFGERHHYALPVIGAETPIRQSCRKAFHVSPFMGMDLDYAFRLEPPGERLALAIAVSDVEGPLLSAVHTATCGPLTDAALARAFAAHPLLAAKVFGGILWEALKLLAKRVPVHRHPARRRG